MPNVPRGCQSLSLNSQTESVDSVGAVPDTPIMRLFHQLRAGRDWGNSQEDLSDESLSSLDDELAALESEIMLLPVTCASDFAAQLIAATADGGVLPDWEAAAIWAKARALTGTDI